MRLIRLLLVVCLLRSVAAAGSTTTPAEGLQTRHYDLRELTLSVPDFVDPPLLGIDGSPSRAGDATGAHDAIDEKDVSRRRMERVVAWARAVCDTGDEAVRAEGDSLAVTADAAAHQRLSAVVEERRRQLKTQVQLQFRVLIVSDATARVLEEGLRRRVTLAAVPGARPVVLSPQDVTAYLAALRNDALAVQFTAPALTLLDGQRAWVATATEQAFVRDFDERVVAGRSEFAPRTGTIRMGFVADARALTAADRSHVSVWLSAQQCRLLALKETPFPHAPPGQKLATQMPEIELWRVEQSLCIPAGGTMLIDFGSVNPVQAAKPLNPRFEGRRPVLLVTATIKDE